jgi:DNA-binding MarR family transcriptional regulator
MTKNSMPGTSECNNAVIRQASRRLGQLYDDMIAPSGLRATQYVLLTEVKTMDRPTLRDLAARLVMDLSALGHSLKPLIRDGFIDLVRDQNDLRVKRVALTKRGEKKFEETARLWQAAQDRFEASFGRARAAALRAVLAEIASDAFARKYLQSTEGSKD